MLGTADKVTVSKDYTTIVNGAGAKENIKERCLLSLYYKIHIFLCLYEKQLVLPIVEYSVS